MTPEQILRISELRSRVIRATYEAFREDGSHKSAEGAADISLCLPNMFESDQRPTWAVSIYSYVIGPGNHTWTDKSLDGALALAEAEVAKWCEPYEFRAFVRRWDDDGEEAPPPEPSYPSGRAPTREDGQARDDQNERRLYTLQTREPVT